MASSEPTEASLKTELAPHKAALLKACLEANSLSFGTFTLKSGRISPYFFNAGALHQGALLSTLSHAFAVTIATFNGADASSAKPSNGSSSDPHGTPGFDFDVLFGPAYKGIPLATTTAVALHGLSSTSSEGNYRAYNDISYAFNRKTAKAYGDGGALVGASLQGKRVLIIDDVITAGTAIREAFDIIESQGGKVVGVVVALDRQEKAPPPADANGNMQEDEGKPGVSAIGEIRRAYGVPVVAVLTLDDIIAGYRRIGSVGDIVRLEEYRSRYRASD